MPQALTSSDLCTRATVCASRAMAVDEAARLMREQHTPSAEFPLPALDSLP